jgi:prepilin-type processing-associated H-X9-DG protein
MHANWLVMLLPQLDQASLHGTWHSSLPVMAVENRAVREAALSILKCPSDAYNDALYLRDGAAGPGANRYARGNYALNFGPDRGCAVAADPENCPDGFHVDSLDLLYENQVVWGSGLGGVNKSFAFKDVATGLSNVVIVDEIRSGPHALDSRGAWALGFVGSSVTFRHGLADTNREDAYGPNNQNPSSDDIVGCAAVAATEGPTWLSSRKMPCRSAPQDAAQASQATARSLHPGGVHVLMCDGSAHFLSDSVSLDVWYRIHKRDSDQAGGLDF